MQKAEVQKHFQEDSDSDEDSDEDSEEEDSDEEMEDQEDGEEEDDEEDEGAGDDEDEDDEGEEGEKTPFTPREKRPDNKSSQLFLRNVSFDTEEEDLEDEFSQFGDVRSCLLVIDPVTERPRGMCTPKHKQTHSHNHTIITQSLLYLVIHLPFPLPFLLSSSV